MHAGPPPHQAGERSQPVAVTATQTTQPTDHPHTTADAERLEVVRELVADLKRLTGFVTDADDRLTRISAEIHEDTAPTARAIWDTAAAELRTALRAPVQLTPGNQPLPLEEAAKTFRHWIDVFTENAVGPGGEGLHDDPERLRAFHDKLESIDPPVTVLVHRTRDLLARHDLSIEALTRKAAKAASLQTQDTDRLAKLEPLIAELKGRWSDQLANTTNQAGQLASALSRLRQTSTDPGTHHDVDTGLAALNRLRLDEARQTLTAIITWADKWRDEPSFTATTLASRIQAELALPLRQTQEELTRLKHQFSPETLMAKQRERDQDKASAEAASQSAILEQIRARYQALVMLRRRKLGTEPDPRYFGTIAKRVNDAITQLANLETMFLTNPGVITEGSVTALLAETNQFVDQGQLEALLRQAEEAAEQEAKTRAAEQEAADHTRRKQREAEEYEQSRQATWQEYERRVAILAPAYQAAKRTFDQALAFATDLETLLPQHAETHYELLERAREIMAKAPRPNQILSTNRDETEIERELAQLEALYGDTGSATVLLQQVNELQQRTNLAELKQRHANLEALRGELRVRTYQLAQVRHSLAQSSAQRRTLTPEEARHWLTQLDRQQGLLADAERELHEVGDRLNELGRHLDDAELRPTIAKLRHRLETLTLPATNLGLTRERPATSPTQSVTTDHRSPIGERLRAEASHPEAIQPEPAQSEPDANDEMITVEDTGDSAEEIDIPIKHE